MNELKVHLQQAIVGLHRQGWSKRRIARELGLDRGTVGKYLRAGDSKPAISLTGSEGASESKPAIVHTGSPAGRQSLCEPWREQIERAVVAVVAEEQDLQRPRGAAFLPLGSEQQGSQIKQG